MADDLSLTWSERLILWNQYEILKHLAPDERPYCERNQKIVEDGYRIFYADMNQSLSKHEFKTDVSKEVMEILDMYRALTFSQKETGHRSSSMWATFQGFDGNDNEGHYGFAEFLRRIDRKWQELEDAPANSHSEVLWKYRKMLTEWKKLGGHFDLTAAQIDIVVEA